MRVEKEGFDPGERRVLRAAIRGTAML